MWRRVAAGLELVRDRHGEPTEHERHQRSGQCPGAGHRQAAGIRVAGVTVTLVVLVGERVSLASAEQVAVTGNAAAYATDSASIMLSQKTGFTSPASIAPGMTAITALSTTSIEEQWQRGERVPEHERQPHRQRDRGNRRQPIAVPTIRPRISPMAQPVRQWRVALAAIALTPRSLPGQACGRRAWSDVELAGGHDIVRLGPTSSAPTGRFSAGAGNDLLEVSAQFVLSVDLRRRLVDREEGRDEYTVLGFNRVTAVAPLAFVDGSAKSERLRAAGCWVELRGDRGKDELDPRGVATVGAVRCERHDISAAGGRGNDSIAGGHTRDRLRGGPGRDRLYGGPGNDELLGDQGRDYARGSSGVDLCRAEHLRTCER